MKSIDSLGYDIGQFVGNLEVQLVLYIVALERVRSVLSDDVRDFDITVPQAIEIIDELLNESKDK